MRTLQEAPARTVPASFADPIIYSSGYVPITRMMKYGLALDVAGFVAIASVLALLGHVAF